MTRAQDAASSDAGYRRSAIPASVMPPVQLAAALGSAAPARARPDASVAAAARVAGDAAAALHSSVAFRQLPIAQQAAIERDLTTIRERFANAQSAPGNGFARAMETPEDFRNRQALARQGFDTTPSGNDSTPPGNGTPAGPTTPRARAATETLAGRTGALIDEVDFPGFVAGLVHGTFDAMVDASIRQMEAFADLVSAVAKNADDFTRDNISRGQAIDWLTEKYPADLTRDVPLASGGPARLRPREVGAPGDEPASPAWLADYGLEGEPLSDEVIEEKLIPAAQRRVGEGRLQTLATMVLMGMNRVVVKDGTIAAKVRFRAAARDTAAVTYAAGQEPGRQSWGSRGSEMYAAPATMISTVNANVQSETDLKAELVGEVRINFVSETLPLDKFIDSARLALLQSHARPAGAAAANAAPAAAALAPAANEPAAPATTPPAPPATTGAGK